MQFKKRFSYPYIAWSVLFVIAPLTIMLLYAFGVLGGEGITLDNFKTFFQPAYLKIFAKSLLMAAICTALCLVVSYPAAYYISRLNGRKRNILFTLIIVPTWMNALLRTYSWMTLLAKNGIINNFLTLFGLAQMNLLYNNGAVFIGMVYNYLPFMLYPIYSALIKTPRIYEKASMDLGANRLTTFFKITLPLSAPGIITGIAMVFIPSVCMFVIPDLLGGAQQMYMGKLIQHQFFQKGDWGFGSALAVILTIVILTIMYFINKYDADSLKGENMQ